MVIGCKSLYGILYIMALKKKINTVRELFMMDIEDGIDTLIPKDLSQDHLPLSFRYYDSIIATIAENITNEKRKILTNRQQLAQKLYYDEDLTIRFLKKVGVIAPENEDNLTFKH